MDMTAWVKAGTKESVGIIQDFVDPDLTSFVEKLVEEYRKSLPAPAPAFAFVTRKIFSSTSYDADLLVDIPAVHTKCGYACSDHASFAKAGYQSAFA